MSRGVLMYAYNNLEIDYFKIACANALMIKKNLGVPVTLVSDAGSISWGVQSLGEDLVHKCFENIITINTIQFDNKRIFNDTSYAKKTLQFYNCNHWEAYRLSPYTETLFIDVDYLIMSDSLNKCWGSRNDFMIEDRILNPGSHSISIKYIDEFSIRQFWATVIYFRKSELAEYTFELVKEIQENYFYYRQLYYFSNGMFRNDNAFSIAVHIMNGFSENLIKDLQLPTCGLIMSWDTHDIYNINGINDISLYVEKEGSGDYLLTRLKNQDVHIMNKWAINRHANRLIELYKD